MAAAYEAVADTRPRIQRDVLYTETPRGVLFHNAYGGFHLQAASAYRFTSLIVPFLNGENRVADLCAGLPEDRRGMVARLVRALYEHGFARDVPPGDDNPAGMDPAVVGRFAPQIAYIDHYADGAHRRFQQFRNTAVAVLGDDPVARWCVVSLLRNGCATVGVLPDIDTPENAFAEVRAEAVRLTREACPAELATIVTGGGPLSWSDLDGYDTVVVTGGPSGPRRIHALLEAGVPEGRTLLPAWTFGDRIVVGPTMGRGTTGCWACAMLRLGGNGGAREAADVWSSVCLGRETGPDQAAPSGPLAAMIGNLLGYEIFRASSGALRAETAGQVLIQDMASLDVVSEPLLPHPRCPFCACAPASPDPSAWTPGAPDPAVAAASGPGSAEKNSGAETVMEELNARAALVQPGTGVFSSFDDESLTQTPLKISTLRLSVGHRSLRRIAAFDVHHVAGARMRALLSAAELYADHVVPSHGVLTRAGTEAEQEPPIRVEVPALATAQDATMSAAPEVSAWTRATSLVTERPALLPTAAVHPFGPHNRDAVFTATRAGTGAGTSPAEAARRGLLSALSHDALQRAVRDGSGVRRVSFRPTEADPELTFLSRTADNLGVEVELLDLGEAGRSSAHVLLARTRNADNGHWEWALGSDFSLHAAAVAAVRDLLGGVQLARELPDGERVDTGDPLMAAFDAGTLVCGGEQEALSASDGSWRRALRGLRGSGRDAWIVPTTSADLNGCRITTVRVLLSSEDGRDC
jgi:bacteriocin biosynthesis cyclodehydratase domain-containing protein